MASLKELALDTFDETIASDTPTLVDFWAPWCGPCRALAPVVEEIASDMAGTIDVAKCNVDDNQDLAMKYHVMSIPTLVLFRGGQEIGRTVGAMPKAKLIEEIKRNL